MKTTSSSNELRPGQIVQGKILKLYPNNKAAIQLGSKMMIAQLEAALTVGEKYFFQVQQTADMVHLKVVNEQVTLNSEDSMMQLLKQLGFKATKGMNIFTQLLVYEKIPFDVQQLQKAFPILEKYGTSTEVLQTLKQMIAQSIPIKESIFQAMKTQHSLSVSTQLSGLFNVLKAVKNPTIAQHALMQQISELTQPAMEGKGVLLEWMLTEARQDNPRLFHMMKALRFIDLSVPFSNWKQQLLHGLDLQGNTKLEQHATSSFPFDVSRLKQLFTSTIGMKATIQEHATTFLNNWAIVEGMPLKGTASLTEQQFTSFKQAVDHVLRALGLPQEGNNLVNVKNELGHLKQIVAMIRTLAATTTFEEVSHMLPRLSESPTVSLPSLKDAFLSHMNRFFQLSGLSLENEIARGNQQHQMNTMKALLLQVVQQRGDTNVSDRAQQLIHVLNGLQLQSVQESGQLIQAQLQFPAGKLGLPQDVKIDFEGRKNANGKIDSDHCRVLFYLELANLKQTVIDMHIQKRAVSIVIFNDHPKLKDYAKKYQEDIKAGLASIDYQLTSIGYEPFKEMERTNPSTSVKKDNAIYEGVDYRI
ncbi:MULTISPECIES: hypothetical protein [unclassified Virgibacillus]|uniref:hypothetical protein n=1 Tax=unclassified Virgibacillus TaxID=2620237 RepID=UPI0024DE24AD|nr:hypothetical protein [Virgibacillus sp. LDC-1]